jgi:hypothetical protein
MFLTYHPNEPVTRIFQVECTEIVTKKQFEQDLNYKLYLNNDLENHYMVHCALICGPIFYTLPFTFPKEMQHDVDTTVPLQLIIDKINHGKDVCKKS